LQKKNERLGKSKRIAGNPLNNIASTRVVSSDTNFVTIQTNLNFLFTKHHLIKH
jgi:hypothetical protein